MLPLLSLGIPTHVTPLASSRSFSLVSPVFSFHKNQYLQIQFEQYRRPAWKSAKADVAFSPNSIIHSFNFFFVLLTRFSRSRNTCDKNAFSPGDLN